MNMDKEQIFYTAGRLVVDEIPTERLAQSWNGFASAFSQSRDELVDGFTKLELRDEPDEITTTEKNPLRSVTSEGLKPSKPKTTSNVPHYKTVRMPKSFPGVAITAFPPEKLQNTSTKILGTENQTETKLTLEDVEKVLTPRRERDPGVEKCREEKLPRIKITKGQSAVPNEGKSGSSSPQRWSHYFNHARMQTELNEVCSLKLGGVAGNKSEENLLTLKTVHDARRYSAFTPRGSRVRPHHARCRSLPNLSTRELPKRFFVKLDPVRASAMQVNLSSWNLTSRRCRFLSENLNKLDEQGIELDEKERKALIGQWIRETSQSNYQAGPGDITQ